MAKMSDGSIRLSEVRMHQTVFLPGLGAVPRLSQKENGQSEITLRYSPTLQCVRVAFKGYVALVPKEACSIMVADASADI